MGIFSDLTHDCVEIYIDGFTVYGLNFEGALSRLEKVLKICKQINLSLSHEKCHMLKTKGIVLGHHISIEGIKVDLAKIEVIANIPAPKAQKGVRIFLIRAGYYHWFIDHFTQIASPLFFLLCKD